MYYYYDIIPFNIYSALILPYQYIYHLLPPLPPPKSSLNIFHLRCIKTNDFKPACMAKIMTLNLASADHKPHDIRKSWFGAM